MLLVENVDITVQTSKNVKEVIRKIMIKRKDWERGSLQMLQYCYARAACPVHAAVLRPCLTPGAVKTKSAWQPLLTVTDRYISWRPPN